MATKQHATAKDASVSGQLINRAPLHDRTNQRLDKRPVKEAKGKMVEDWFAVEGGADKEEGELVFRMKEMEAALRETLEENRRLHDECSKLRERNESLVVKTKQLDVVTMLYDAAKSEIEELSKRLLRLSPEVSPQDTESITNNPLPALVVEE